MRDGTILNAAFKLAQAMNKVADDQLPGRLAGIVKLHAGLGVGSALIPVPIVDVLANGTNIWTMYVRINREIEMPFSENLMKSVATGVATNIGASVAAAVTIGTALKFLPGLGSLGGAALMGGTMYGVTVAAGVVYMQAIVKVLGVKPPEHVTETDVKAATEEILKDKKRVREMVEEGKKTYEVEEKKEE